jgi:hypothetical protein
MPKLATNLVAFRTDSETILVKQEQSVLHICLTIYTADCALEVNP